MPHSGRSYSVRYFANLITGLQRFTRLGRNARTSRARTRKSTILNLEELGPRLLPSGTPIGIVGTSGGGQSTPVNTTFLNSLTLTVENLDSGRGVYGYYVTFTAPASGPSGTFSNGSTTISGTTNSEGILSESFTANAAAGSYTVTAKISGLLLGTASFGLTNNKDGPPANTLIPQEVKDVYGFNSVPAFKVGNQSYQANGQGQTIAILDPGSDPNVALDLATFSSAFNLLQCDGKNGDPTFTVVDENGGTNYPPESSQIMEIDQDVEWAHAIAPGANIILIEINGFNNGDVENGLGTAHRLGASVVSMSFLLAHDLEQTPPAGVTYVSAAGDAYGDNFGSVTNIVNGTPTSTTTFTSGVGSNDLIVGGTELTQNATQLAQNNDAYPGEQVWDQYAIDSTQWPVTQANGNGTYTATYDAGTTYGTYQNVRTTSNTNPIQSVPLPSWQTAAAADVGQQTGTTPTDRMVPDVSMLATRVQAVDYTDNASNPWANTAWGTSLATPMWAGLIAIANEGRHVQGLSPLNSTDDPILPAVYNLPSFDFNHVTSDTQYAYDQQTGLGTPKANLIIPALAAPDGQLPNGQLTIQGNSIGTDTITVNVVNVTIPFLGTQSVVQVQVNSLTSYFLASEVRSIVVNALAATDTVNINATPAGVPLTINLGPGTDTVNINGLGGAPGTGLGGLAAVNGYGPFAPDTLNVNDMAPGSAAMTSYYVTDWTIQRNTGNGVIFEDLSGVTLNGLSPASTGGQVSYNIGSTPSGVVSAFPPPGAATLSVNGSGSAGRNEFTIGGSQNYYFGTLQTLDVSTGRGGENNVYVDTLPQGVALNISSAGVTEDSVYVGEGSQYSLAGIQGAINISNTSGQTNLLVDGSGDASANYDLTSSTLRVSNGPTITYQGAAPIGSSNSVAGVTSLFVIEGGAQDDFDAESVAPLTNVTVENLQTANPTITGLAAGSVHVKTFKPIPV
jgi:hypothetical protein